MAFTEKQIKKIEEFKNFAQQEEDRLILLCELAVNISDGYEELIGEGNTHGDNMIIRNKLLAITNMISSILSLIEASKGYDYANDIKYKIYDDYFHHMKGFKVYPQIR